MNEVPETIDIEALVSDRDAFNEFVYTSLDKAIIELQKRTNNEGIGGFVKAKIPGGLPELFTKRKVAILFRQLATPNYEMRRFVSIIDAIDDLYPIIWEYHQDKFTSNNETKHALGKVCFYFGKGKNGGAKINKVNIIDFNTYNGKKISEVKTMWDQRLIDFHHQLFDITYPGKLEASSFFDASEWFSQAGGNAGNYYKHFLALFLQNGILFENFMLDVKELTFTKEIFLPAFIEIWKTSGYKPLIVALAPTEIEGENFWMCYPPESEEYINGKLKV